MKIKIDFVTNSSSEVFGIVAGSAAAAAGISVILEALFKACRDQSETKEEYGADSSGGYGEIIDAPSDAEDIAKTIAEAALEDAKRQENVIKNSYTEAEKALDTVESEYQKEIDEYKSAWEESEKTSDKTDPGYDEFKQKYEDYMKYLQEQIVGIKEQRKIIEAEKAETLAGIAAKDAWIEQRQVDLIAIKEEKALLEAVAKGYDIPGYNTDAVKERLKQLNGREAELTKTLEENNASIDYTPQSRGEIGPSKESKDLTDRIAAERKAFEEAAKEATAEKKKQLEAEMEKNIAEYKAAMKTGDRFEMAEKAAEGVVFGADVAVEGLAYVTGPAGQKVKLAYKAGKALGTGVGEGMADPKNASKHLAKGLLNAGTEVIKDRLGEDNPWKKAAVNVLNEGAQGAIDSSIKGEDITKGAFKGAIKGAVDAGIDEGLDKLKNKLVLPDTPLDHSNVDAGSLFNGNPLAKDIAKGTVRGALENKGKDIVKDALVSEIGERTGFIDKK